MNHILYNISILILGFGIILMTVYITKATNKQFKNNQNNQNRQYQTGIAETGDIYDSRPSKTYSKMFSQPSLWLGYQEFDSNENTEKIYIK